MFSALNSHCLGAAVGAGGEASVVLGAGGPTSTLLEDAGGCGIP